MQDTSDALVEFDLANQQGQAQTRAAPLSRLVTWELAPFSSLSAVETLSALESRTRRRQIRGGLAPWRAKRLVAYIDTKLTKRVSIGELARMTGISNGHFSRAFKQTFGVSPRTFLRCRRVQVAQKIMLSTDLPLSQIARECGLCDQPHLSKTFRSVVGETPSAFRRARSDAIAIRIPVEVGASIQRSRSGRELNSHGKQG